MLRARTGSRPIRRTCSSSLNTLTPVMTGPLPGSRAPAQLTATRSHTGAGVSVTTASVCQWVWHWPHWEL